MKVIIRNLTAVIVIVAVLAVLAWQVGQVALANGWIDLDSPVQQTVKETEKTTKPSQDSERMETAIQNETKTADAVTKTSQNEVAVGAKGTESEADVSENNNIEANNETDVPVVAPVAMVAPKPVQEEVPNDKEDASSVAAQNPEKSKVTEGSGTPEKSEEPSLSETTGEPVEQSTGLDPTKVFFVDTLFSVAAAKSSLMDESPVGRLAFDLREIVCFDSVVKNTTELAEQLIGKGVFSEVKTEDLLPGDIVVVAGEEIAYVCLGKTADGDTAFVCYGVGDGIVRLGTDGDVEKANTISAYAGGTIVSVGSCDGATVLRLNDNPYSGYSAEEILQWMPEVR